MAQRGYALVLSKYFEYFKYAFKTYFLRQTIPYLFIVVINDKCNLNCFYCTSKNSGKYHFSYSNLISEIDNAYSRGHRLLVITGGEPMLWEDDGHTLKDIVQYSLLTGFQDIYIYTNGTHALDAQGCSYIVTIDGTKDIHNSIRDNSYDLILKNIRRSKSKSIFASITINKENEPYLEEIVKSITDECVFKGISFNLLTHNAEVVRLNGLLGEKRVDVIDRMWKLKKQGYPVVFSRAAYKALRKNSWKRPIPQIQLATNSQLFECCRDVVNPEICENCGYSSCAEISQVLSLKPSAILEAFKTV